MDNKGSAMIEITIILIIIVMILGITAYISQITTQKISDTAENENTEVKLSEIIDYMINNPGEYNWQDYKTIPGLAIVNENGETVPNSISYSKFTALGSDYKKLVDDKIFNNNLKSSIELIPTESSISSVKIGSDDKEGKNVFSVNRYVKCDFYKKYVIHDFKNDDKCNHNHNPSSSSCSYLKIFKGNLRSSDYYLLIKNSSKYNTKYIIDTTQDKSGNWNEIDKDVIYVNDKINFYNDTSEIVFIHFDKKDMDAVLVSLPKNFDKDKLKYDYFITNNCNLILKAWYE